MNQFHDSGSVQAKSGRSPFKCFAATFVALATLLVFAVVSIASTQPSAVGADTNTTFDLKNWVTSVTMEKKSKSDWQWVPATGDNIAEGDSLRFSLEYTVPGNTLSEGNRTLTYEAPFNTAKAESGKVLNNAGEELGTYTINEQGKISITFNETTATKNQNGSPIDGYIRFQADVDKINSGEGGKFDFGDNHEITINVKKASDLTITKTAAQQGDDGTIKIRHHSDQRSWHLRARDHHRRDEEKRDRRQSAVHGEGQELDRHHLPVLGYKWFNQRG